MGLVLGRKPEHETVSFFRVKWLQPAMEGTSCVCVCVKPCSKGRFVFCDFCCAVFQTNDQNRGTAWLVAVAVQRRGCYKSLKWILDAESTYLFWSVEPFVQFFLSSWQGGQARNHPRRLRQYKAFQGIFPLLKRVTKNQRRHAVLQVCFGRGSVMVRSWSWFYQASEVLQLIDLFAGSDALFVKYVCPCQAPATGEVCSSSVCQKHWFSENFELILD